MTVALPLFQTTEERALSELDAADLESRRLTAGSVARWDWPAVNRSLSRLAAAWKVVDEARVPQPTRPPAAATPAFRAL